MEFVFKDPGCLEDAEIRLILLETVVDASGEEPLPTYRFQIQKITTSEPAGFINLRIGSGENLVLYRGHIGYAVDEPFRGKGYAARACRLLMPFAAANGIGLVWITCNPDNIASRKTCEAIGAELIETITVPEHTEAYRAGARVKCRYRLSSLKDQTCE